MSERLKKLLEYESRRRNQAANMKSSPYAGYDIHYMYLRDLDLGELPTSIEVDGHTLILKSEFHISLVCAVRLAPLINKRGSDKVAAEIIEAFDGFV